MDKLMRQYHRHKVESTIPKVLRTNTKAVSIHELINSRGVDADKRYKSLSNWAKIMLGRGDMVKFIEWNLDFDHTAGIRICAKRYPVEFKRALLLHWVKFTPDSHYHIKSVGYLRMVNLSAAGIYANYKKGRLTFDNIYNKV